VKPEEEEEEEEEEEDLRPGRSTPYRQAIMSAARFCR
jgi:hypothetical protein